MAFPGGVFSDADIQTENTKLQTTGAASTTLWSRAIPASTVQLFEATVVGVKSDGSEHASYRRVFTVKRTSGGSATVMTDDYAPTPDQESDATWGGPTVTATSGTVTLAVVGKAVTTINWRCRVDLLAG